MGLFTGITGTIEISCLLLGTLTFGFWIALRGACRGTTLMAPWCWSGAVLASTFLLTVAPDVRPTGVARFFVVSLLVCPFMALLGAKRPQDHAWQFVVLSLWVILSLPAWYAWAYGDFARAQVKPDSMRLALVVLLLVVQWANWLGTSFWLANSWVMVGQVMVSAPFLPWIGQFRGAATSPGWALACYGMGLVIAWRVAHRERWPAERSLKAINQVWRNWRNRYGTVWGLRVWERLHDAIVRNPWPVQAGWHGVVPWPGRKLENDLVTDEPTSANLPPRDRLLQDAVLIPLATVEHSLLRRFLAEQQLVAIRPDVITEFS